MFAKVRRILSFALLASLFFLSIGTGIARADGDSDSGRKVKSKVAPIFPDLARRMRLSGAVKVEIVIAPNGSVKNTKVIGGHPLLVDPAVDAVKKWRFEPASEETTETIEFKFSADK